MNEDRHSHATGQLNNFTDIVNRVDPRQNIDFLVSNSPLSPTDGDSKKIEILILPSAVLFKVLRDWVSEHGVPRSLVHDGSTSVHVKSGACPHCIQNQDYTQ